MELFKLAHVFDILSNLALDPEVQSVQFETFREGVDLVSHYDHPVMFVFYLFEYFGDN